MKYLGLDVGKTTIGVAVGEAIASELVTLRAKKGESFYSSPAIDRAIEDLRTIMEEEGAGALVVGLPVKEDGSHSEESAQIHQFGEKLKTALGTNVYYINETLTSFMARDILESQGVEEKEIERRLDQVSAELILQQYLEENAHT